MRITLALLCFLVVSMTGFGQDTVIDLNKYKFPDYKRHQMELNFNTNGYNSKESRDQNYMNLLETHDYSNFTNSSRLQLGYDYTFQTRERMDNLNFSLSGDYNYSQSKYDDQKTSQSNPEISGVLNGFKRYYLTEDKLFFEGLTGLSYSFRETKQKTPDIGNDYYNKYNTLSVNAGIGVGFGRIERVSDLWQAHYILQKLNQQNSLQRQLDEKDIFEFATLASQLKNKRFLDSRTRRIFELKELDSLLHEQGLILESDISYFATLNDYWSYGIFPNRSSGKELKLWVTPTYTSSNSEYENNGYFSTSEYKKTSLISNVSLNCRKQLNLTWERNFNAQVSYEVMLDTIGHMYNYHNKAIESQTSFGYGYYPNSRTNLNAAIGYLGRTVISRDIENIEDVIWSSTAVFHLKSTYYFSPHLQLEASYSVNYTDKTSSSIDYIYQNYNLALRYAIF